MDIIKNITALETILIRQPVLRAGRSIESCHFEGDDLPSTKHFGIYYDKKLVGVVSVFSKINSIFNSPNQFQLRGMAILSEFQKRGFGEKLLQHCEDYIKSQNGSMIWFNARVTAVSFYEKSHYKKISRSARVLAANGNLTGSGRQSRSLQQVWRGVPDECPQAGGGGFGPGARRQFYPTPPQPACAESATGITGDASCGKA